MLHIPAQRSGTVLGIVGSIHNCQLGCPRQLHFDLLIVQPTVQLCNLQVDDLCDIVLGQRLVEYDLIQPVLKLRTEGAAKQALHLCLGSLVDGTIRIDAV